MSAMTDRLREALENIVGSIDGCADAPARPDSLIQMVKAEALAVLASEAGVSEEWRTDLDAAPGDGTEIEVKFNTDDPRRVQWTQSRYGSGWHLTGAFTGTPIRFEPTHWRPISRQQPAAEAGALLISASRVREIIDAVDRMGLGPEEFARRVTDEILKASPPSPSPQKPEGGQ